MKKLLLSLVAIFAAVSMAQAAPQFGLGITTADGAGIGGVNPGIAIVDDMYSVRLSVKNTNIDEVKNNTIGLKANYNIPLNATTTATAGVAYNTVSGDTYSTYNDMRLVAGIQQNIASNIIFSADVNVYQAKTTQATGAAEAKETNLLNGGSLGLIVLF